MYLPRSLAPAAAPTATVETELLLSKSGETVLAVEDDEASRDVVAAMLENLGYAVIVAGDSQEALKILSTAPCVDILLTDVWLPGGMSGPALAHEAHKYRPALKVLFISGYAKGVIENQNELESGLGFLAKPFTMKELAHKLRGALDS